MTYFAPDLRYNNIRNRRCIVQTIYIDVLIILNVYVNYFLLMTTAKLTRSRLRTARCIAASFYGSLFSLVILLPELSLTVNLLIKLSAAVTVVMAAFGISSRRRLLLNTAAFFAANFIFAGGIYAIYALFKPDFMHVANGGFYIDFSLLALIISTAVLYGAVCLIRRLCDRSPEGESKVIIRTHGRIFSCEGLADSGNSLTDLFSGRPVIICGAETFREIFGEISAYSLPKGFRLLPFSTISDSGLIPVFRPDETIIVNTLTGERKSVDVSIGLRENGKKAIFNPKIFKN